MDGKHFKEAAGRERATEDAPDKPFGPLAGKSMDPNAGSFLRTDNPGVSHGDPAGEKS